MNNKDKARFESLMVQNMLVYLGLGYCIAKFTNHHFYRN